ncbi:hypothetical protein [Tepidibacter hydrothermalis]|uniref:PIR Superfamily Protein n=1 Tax=Tepidibacter hydrothermalis TaxID=3036126 RepID=A0ABY8E782_9FIRM|nr:hypothetical protein [Tepidibacter hydrothermalis]WFD08756.1 hypothetical protein P4S50_10135 [Tepidibacter hydrothermalis]
MYNNKLIIEVTEKFNYPTKKYQNNLGNSYYATIKTIEDVQRSIGALENILKHYENRDFDLCRYQTDDIKKTYSKCQIAIHKVVSCYYNEECDFHHISHKEVISMFELLENQYKRSEQLDMARKCQD